MTPTTPVLSLIYLGLCCVALLLGVSHLLWMSLQEFNPPTNLRDLVAAMLVSLGVIGLMGFALGRLAVSHG